MKSRTFAVMIVIATIIFFVASPLSSYLSHNDRTDTVTVERIKEVHDTTIIRDTIRKEIIIERERIELERVFVPKDTILAIEQVVYSDSDYTAYITGIEPRLDSITIYPKSYIYTDSVFVYRDNYITKTKNRFRLNLQVGIGVTPHGFEPYLGIEIPIW